MPLGNRAVYFSNIENRLGSRSETENISDKLILLLEQFSLPEINKDRAELHIAFAASRHGICAVKTLMREHQIEFPVSVQIHLEDALVIKAANAVYTSGFYLLINQIVGCLAVKRSRSATRPK